MVAWTARSAGPLTARAPQLAVDLLGRSLALAGPDDPLAGPLRLHLTVALMCAGRSREAEEHARQALTRGTEPALEPALHWILAQSLFLRGRPDLAAQAAETARAAPAVPPAEAARFHAFASVCLVSMGRADEAEAIAERLRGPDADGGDAAATAFALQTLAIVRLLGFRYEQALELLREALRIVPESPQSCHRLALQLSLANCHLERDRTGAAHAELAVGRRLAEQRGGFFLPWYHLSEALLLFRTGRWDDADAEIQAGREPGEHFGMSRALRGLAALIALHQGRGPEAAGHLAAARAGTGNETIAPFYAHLTLRAEALDHEVRGATEQAFAVLAGALDAAAGGPGGGLPCCPSWRSMWCGWPSPAANRPPRGRPRTGSRPSREPAAHRTTTPKRSAAGGSWRAAPSCSSKPPSATRRPSGRSVWRSPRARPPNCSPAPDARTGPATSSARPWTATNSSAPPGTSGATRPGCGPSASAAATTASRRPALAGTP